MRSMKRSRGGERGAVAPMLAILLPVLIGMAALAFDIGRLMVVRNELQNAADAAALAGAGHFGRGGATADWTLVESQARAAVALNRADFATLVEGEVSSGYWNVKNPAQGLQPASSAPKEDEYPAVRVRIGKDQGVNGGKMRFYLAPVIGVDSGGVWATATTVVSSPGAVGVGGLFPFAIKECLLKDHWNSTANPPGPVLDPGTGQAPIFKVYSAHRQTGCDAGQWTSLTERKPNGKGIESAAYDKSLMLFNSVAMAVGEPTFIQNGEMANLFGETDDCATKAPRSCEFVTLPVVRGELVEGQDAVVAGFVCVHIVSAKQGTETPYIRMQFSTGCRTPNASGVGPNLGARTPPRLVQ